MTKTEQIRAKLAEIEAILSDINPIAERQEAEMLASQTEPEPTPEYPSAHDKGEIDDLAQAVFTQCGRERLVMILNELNVERVRDIPESKYAAFYERANQEIQRTR